MVTMPVFWRMNVNETEKTVGIVHAGLTRGAKTTYYDLIFTNERIVFVKTGGIHVAWFALCFFFFGIGAVIYALIAMSKRNGAQRTLSGKSVAAMLAMSGDNYAIPYSELKSIRIFARRKLEIVTASNKNVLVLFGPTTANASKAQLGEYMETIKAAVADKLVQ